MRFCPICGKQGIKGDFCEDCRPDESGLEFKEIVIPICVECGKYFLNNKWKPAADIDAAVIAVAKQRIRNPKNIKLAIEPLLDKIEPKPGWNPYIELKVIAQDQEFIIPGKIRFTYCPKCGKAGSQYFEGILQLRDVDKDVKRFVEQRLKDAEQQGIFTNNIIKQKNGADYYLTDKKFLRKLGKELNKQFNGELKESPQLFSRDKQASKNIYRLNVLFRQG